MTGAAPTPSANGAFPREPRQAAEVYLGHGLAPIDLPVRSKDPQRDGWQHERLTRDDLDRRFPSQVEKNVGILNGSPSNNEADVDLDVEEARRLADIFLPPTGSIFGRLSAPRSHRIYR